MIVFYAEKRAELLCQWMETRRKTRLLGHRGAILRVKLCSRVRPDVPTSRHLSLRDPIVNLISFTRPSGEGSVLSGKTCFFHARGAGNKTTFFHPLSNSFLRQQRLWRNLGTIFWTLSLKLDRSNDFVIQIRFIKDLEMIK